MHQKINQFLTFIKMNKEQKNKNEIVEITRDDLTNELNQALETARGLMDKLDKFSSYYNDDDQSDINVAVFSVAIPYITQKGDDGDEIMAAASAFTCSKGKSGETVLKEAFFDIGKSNFGVAKVIIESCDEIKNHIRQNPEMYLDLLLNKLKDSLNKND